MIWILIIITLPVTLPFVVLRFVIRWAGRLFLPVELVFMAFAYAIAWCLYRMWNITGWQDEPLTSEDQEASETPAGWGWWGMCLTEAAYDTLTILVLVMLGLEYGFAIDLGELADHVFGDAEPLAWIPFWIAALVPFLIRLQLYEPVMIDQAESSESEP